MRVGAWTEAEAMKRRSIRSRYGKMPVPPPKNTTSPGGRESIHNPLPCGPVISNVSLGNVYSIFVNLFVGVGYLLMMSGNVFLDEVFPYYISVVDV